MSRVYTYIFVILSIRMRVHCAFYIILNSLLNIVEFIVMPYKEKNIHDFILVKMLKYSMGSKYLQKTLLLL